MAKRYMTAQEELDAYGDIIIASTEEHVIGQIIPISMSIEEPDKIGDAVVLSRSTLADFKTRGKGEPSWQYRYFHRVVAE